MRNRERIIEYVTKNPRSTTTDISRGVDGNRTVTHARLLRLQDEGLVLRVTPPWVQPMLWAVP